MSIHLWHLLGVMVPYALFATAVWGLAAGAIKDAVAVGSLPEHIEGAFGRVQVRLRTVPYAYVMGFVGVAFVYGCVLDRSHMIGAIGADPHTLAPGADAVLYGLAAASWLSAGLLTGGYRWLRRGTRRLLSAPAARDRAETRYHLLAEHLTDLVAHHTPDGRYEWVSGSAQAILGVAPEALVGRDAYHLVHPDDVDRVRSATRAQLAGDASAAHVRYRIRHADGHHLWFESLTEPLTDASGAVVGLQVSSRDVTERQAIEDDLRHRAHFDALTGLANRALLTERLTALTAISREGGPGGQFAVLYVDLDRFKAVNDTRGHAAGDAVLVEVARRIERTTRGRDLVARIGGDEFAVLLDGVGSEPEAVRAALRIEDVFEVPFLVDGAPRELTASIGVALGRPAHASATDVLREADLATYRAKARPRNADGPSWVVFSAELQAAHDRRRRIEADLRDAIVRDELCVAYQPLVDLASGAVCGVEALLRWNHPELGLLGPGAFIDIAEETGCIGDLDRWVLAEGLAQLSRWEADLGPLDLSLCVNCSAHDLDDPAFATRIRALVGDRAGRVVLEITESSLIGDTGAAAAVLASLAADGVRIAMDDFGTGYSSLSVVHALPIDKLKVDRAFVQRMHEDAAAQGMVETVLGFARTLGATVVAEGIETPSQLALLREMGCDVGQGYLFARPLAPDAMRTLLASETAWPIALA